MPDFMIILGLLDDIQHTIHIMDCDGISIEKMLPTTQVRAPVKAFNVHCPRKSFGHGGSIYCL